MPNLFLFDFLITQACVASSDVRFALVAGGTNQLACQATTTLTSIVSPDRLAPGASSTETTLWFSSKKMLMTPGAEAPSTYLPPAYHALKSLAPPVRVFSGKIIWTSSVRYET